MGMAYGSLVEMVDAAKALLIPTFERGSQEVSAIQVASIKGGTRVAVEIEPGPRSLTNLHVNRLSAREALRTVAA